MEIQVGERIRELRTEKGLSQADLARKLGVSPVTVYRWEGGTRVISLTMLGQVATVLDAELSEFFPKAQASLFQPEEEQRRDEDPLEIAYNAAVEQARQDAQTMARAGESDQPQISHVSAENEAAVKLDQKFRSYDLAVALVDMARQNVHLEQNNAALEARLNELQDLERT